MPNNITHVTSYLSQILDEVYKKASVSAVLDLANNMVRPVEGAKGIVQIPSIAFDGGLVNYDKSAGFDAGTVDLTWKPFELTQDRGRRFNIDAVDNLESAGVALANVGSEFLRTYVIPEIDAYRFAKYATNAGTKQTGALTSADIEEALEVAITTLADKEVPKERLKLFMSNTAYSALKSSVKARRDVTGLSVVNGIAYYDDIPVYPVPATRFNSAVTLSKGFTPSGSAINFMLLDSASAVQVTRHIADKLFTPEENQSADGYLWRYRVYHDAFVPENKKNGIFVHTAS